MIQRETPTSVLTFHPLEGILEVAAKSASELKLSDAVRDFETGRDMVEGKKVPVLSDPRKLFKHSKEVRAYFASEEMKNHISAMAVLVENFTGSLFGNFFIYITRPPYPTRLFTDDQAAREWLNKFR